MEINYKEKNQSYSVLAQGGNGHEGLGNPSLSSFFRLYLNYTESQILSWCQLLLTSVEWSWFTQVEAAKCQYLDDAEAAGITFAENSSLMLIQKVWALLETSVLWF